LIALTQAILRISKSKLPVFSYGLILLSLSACDVKSLMTATNRPVAQSQSLAVNYNTPTPVVLAATVTTGTVSYALVSNPSHGALAGAGANWTYTPTNGYIGPDSFVYQVNDSVAGTSLSSTVHLNVSPATPILSYTNTTGLVGNNIAVPTSLIQNGSSVTGCIVLNTVANPTAQTDFNNAGFTIGATTCAISAASANALPTETFTIQATNAAGPSTATVTLTVNTAAPSIAYNNFTGTTGTSATIAPSTLNDHGAFINSCSVTTGTLPIGLTISAPSCQIIGTPTSFGSGPYVVTAMNSVGSTSSASFTMTFNPGGALVTSLSPTTGTTGTVITITGSGFIGGSGGTTVSVGGNTCTGVVVNAAGTSLQCSIPAGNPGSSIVTLTNPTWPGVTAGTFIYNYPAPTLASISPTSGTPGASITLTGTGYYPATTVSVGGQACAVTSSPSASGSTTLTCTTSTSLPPGTTQNVVVTNPVGQTATLTNGFTVTYPTPTLTSVSPTSGAAGSAITLTGTGYYPATTVTVGGQACAITSTQAALGSTSMTCTTNGSLASGAQPVVVTNPTSLTATGSFTVTASTTVSSFTYCGATQAWPTAASGLPYSDPGTDANGWTQIAGNPVWSGGGYFFNPPSGVFTPFTTLASFNPIVTSKLSGGSYTGNGQTYYSLPATIPASSDFTYTVQFSLVQKLSAGIRIVLADSNQHQAFMAYLNDYGSEIDTVCNLQAATGALANKVAVTSGTFPTGTDQQAWATTGVSQTLILKRVGTVISVYYGIPGIEASRMIMSYDMGTSFGGIAGFEWEGDSLWQFSNITINTPTNTWAPPTISSITPTSGLAGSEITINGTGFYPGTTVTVGGQACAVISTQSNSGSTPVTCKTSSSLAAGLQSVVLTSLGGSVTASTGFTVVSSLSGSCGNSTTASNFSLQMSNTTVAESFILSGTCYGNGGTFALTYGANASGPSQMTCQNGIAGAAVASSGTGGPIQVTVTGCDSPQTLNFNYVPTTSTAVWTEIAPGSPIKDVNGLAGLVVGVQFSDSTLPNLLTGLVCNQQQENASYLNCRPSTSLDQGATWNISTAASLSEPDTEGWYDAPPTIVRAPSNSNYIYYAVNGHPWSGALTKGGLYVSTDGGATWSINRFEAGFGGFGSPVGQVGEIQDIVVDPANENNIWMTRGYDDYTADLGRLGLYSSTDAGQHWTAVCNADNHPNMYNGNSNEDSCGFDAGVGIDFTTGKILTKSFWTVNASTMNLDGSGYTGLTVLDMGWMSKPTHSNGFVSDQGIKGMQARAGGKVMRFAADGRKLWINNSNSQLYQTSGAWGTATKLTNISPGGSYFLVPHPAQACTWFVQTAAHAFQRTQDCGASWVTFPMTGFTETSSAILGMVFVPASSGELIAYTANGRRFKTTLGNSILPQPGDGTTPTLTSISPTSGGPGAAITLTGSNFYPNTTVTVGGQTCTLTTTQPSTGSTTMTCTTSSSMTLGSKNVVVSTFNGGSATLTGAFNAVYPANSTIYFCDHGDSLWNDASNWYQNSSCTTPAQRVPGNGDSVVIENVSNLNFFTDSAPVVSLNGYSGLAPADGTGNQTSNITIAAGGTTNITGGNWGGHVSVAITHESTAKALHTNSVTVSTSGPNRTIVVYAASASGTEPVVSGAGLVWMKVTTANNGSWYMDMYVAVAPSALSSATINLTTSADIWVDVFVNVSTVTPVDQSITASSGTSVSLTPTLAGTVTVAACADWSDSNITAATGYSAGSTDVVDGSWFSILGEYSNSIATANQSTTIPISAGNCSYMIGANLIDTTPGSPPTVTLTSVSPASGYAGASITLSGTNFNPTSTVTVGGQPCALTTTQSNSGSTTMSCTTSGSLSLGAQDVVVTNYGGVTATRTGGFTVLRPPLVANSTIYYCDQGNSLWNNSANWFEDSACSIPAQRVAGNGDSIIIENVSHPNFFTDVVPTISLSGYSGLAPADGTGNNTAHITIVAGGTLNVTGGNWGGQISTAIVHESSVAGAQLTSIAVTTNGTNRTIVVYAATANGTEPVVSGAGLTWTKVTGANNGGGWYLDMYVALAPTALTAATINISSTSDTYVDVFSNVSTVTAIDQSNNGSSVGTSITITPTQAGTMPLAACADWGDSNITAASGYSAGTTEVYDGAWFTLLGEYSNTYPTAGQSTTIPISAGNCSMIVGANLVDK
jgi:hypothetical protein